MSSAHSLYRRHRPRTFSDVVGQQHIVRTLRNAISQDKIHHAYLFVGSRGTGKTSMAKILAAALNCTQLVATTPVAGAGQDLDPCGVCDSCRAITNGSSLDVIEMDAASHNSVDDIRDLRDKVAFAPVSGRHKVYILDEAHMLSTAAWNAFLKTLEEPPPHTVFVLATTEPQKVLATVVDRCHRFDFGRPNLDEIDIVLSRVTEEEEINLAIDARRSIARSASGSFRDALGTLEQLVAYAGKTISTEDVLAVLGMADSEYLHAALDSVAKRDPRSAFATVAGLADSGRDITRFLSDFESELRAVMIAGALKHLPEELKFSPEHDQAISHFANAIPQADVIRLLEGIAASLRKIKDGADARTQLEVLLLKTICAEHDASMAALLSRIERLEKGAPPPPAFESQAEGEVETTSGRDLVMSEESVSPPVSDQEIKITDAKDAADMAEPVPVAPAVSPSTQSNPEPANPTGETDQPAGEEGWSLERFQEIWPSIVQSIGERSPMLAALLQDAHPSDLTEGALTLSWIESAAFLKRKAEDPRNKDVIVKTIRQVAGVPFRVEYELCGDNELSLLPPTEISGDALVKRLVSEFDGEEIIPEESEA